MATARDLIQIGANVTIGGKQYELGELNAADYALCEEEIVKDRPSRGEIREAGAVMIAALPVGDPDRSEIARETFKQVNAWRRVTAGEVNEWKVTPRGFIFGFWLMIRKKHPGIDLEEAFRLVDILGNESMQEIADTLSGMPEGNSPGPAAEKTTEEIGQSHGSISSQA